VQITTASLPPSVLFRWYEQTVQASGGPGGLIWSITSGSLPRGMRLDPATGRIHGRPRLKGIWTFTIEARDPQNTAASREFTIASRLHY
jgi:hypothetical protein